MMELDRSNIRVLIVEDDEDIAQVIANTLRESHNFVDITIKENGVAALNHIRENMIDVILSDMHMPEMDGMTFLQQLKRENLFHRVFVFFTGYASLETALESVKIGVFDYVEKPLTADFGICIENICLFLGGHVGLSDIYTVQTFEEIDESIEGIEAGVMEKTNASILVKNFYRLQKISQFLSSEIEGLIANGLEIKLKQGKGCGDILVETQETLKEMKKLLVVEPSK